MSKISESQLNAFKGELEKLGSKWYSAASAVKRFGQRQAHSLTGWTPKGFNNVKGIEEMGAGASSARKALTEAASKPENKKALLRAQERVHANEKAQELGLTSLPGTVKALANKETRSPALRAAWEQQMRGTTFGQKALTLGLPAAGLAAETLSPDDGRKGERMGAGIAGTAAGMLTGGLPLAGGTVAGLAAGYAGGKIGRGFDHVRAKLRPPGHEIQAPPNPEEARGQSVATERVMSPAVAGQHNEVIG
jgi:hypothetical protein